MADKSRIRIDGTAYDLKDAAAREAITEITQDVDDLKNAVTNRTAGVLDSDGESDLDITDHEGNVLLRLANGGIKTKKFDSANLNPYMQDDDSDADLNIADVYGNVLVQCKNGNFQTKNFRGFTFVTFASDVKTYNGSALTLAVDHEFRKGDHVVLHCERGAMPWDIGAVVTYYEDSAPIKSNWQGDCGYYEHVIMTDGAKISAVYGASASGMPNGEVKLEVNLLGDIPITPKVITVKQDGTGDYTTLRGALDAIGASANEALNPYRIEIYPGTYNVMDDYSDAEIGAAVYSQTGFVGPKLLDGMHLIGMGLPQETIINGYLPTTWSYDIRNEICPLNMQGDCSVENLTIISTNLRYSIHDDFEYLRGQKRRVMIKNLIMRCIGLRTTTYGAGTPIGGMILHAENCDFGDGFGVHNQRAEAGESLLFFRNCKAGSADFGDIVNQDIPATRQNQIVFDSCDFRTVSAGTWSMPVYTIPHNTFRGTLTCSPVYAMHPDALYDTSDVVHAALMNLPVGTAVQNAATGINQWSKATSAVNVSGVIVHNDSYNSYVQFRGYVATNRLGLTNFAVGDWIGIDSDGASVVVQDANDAYGRVAFVYTSGVGYVKIGG